MQVSASRTREFIGTGGYIDHNAIEFITVSTTGNATDFGDLTSTKDIMVRLDQ